MFPLGLLKLYSPGGWPPELLLTPSFHTGSPPSSFPTFSLCFSPDSQVHTFTTHPCPELWSQASLTNLHPYVSPSPSAPHMWNFIELLCSVNCALWILVSWGHHDSPFPAARNLIVLLASFISVHIQAATNFFPSSLPTPYCVEF